MGIKIRETRERLITPSGMVLVGAQIKKMKLRKLLDRLGKPKDVKHQNSSCVIGYTGLLCQGKSDYDDVREMREDADFYCASLHISSVPSAETLRQRLDKIGPELASSGMIMEESGNMLKGSGVSSSPTFTGHIPLDVNVCVHDNSQTKKEGVERTYKGIDGYAPACEANYG